jgi:DNA replication protein DnaC
MLKSLRLSGILETLELRNRGAIESKLSYVEFLAQLVEDEVERRAQHKLKMRLRRAAFDPQKTLETFDFAACPKLSQKETPTSDASRASPVPTCSSSTTSA